MRRSILMLEHDDDDRYITQTTFEESGFLVQIHFVNSTDELFAFLISCERSFLPYPGVILINHNSGPASAVDLLKQLKGDPRHSHIPVVVLSGSCTDEMLIKCYSAGANSFIKKPFSGVEITEKISTFVRYWFNTVELP